MKYRIKVLSLGLCILLSHSIAAQQNQEAEKLDAMIVQGMKDWKVPGIAAVVVKDGDVVFQKTYGVKNVSTNEPVDDNTLFNMGSTTKAVVAIAMGMLVDEGKVQWDDLVIDHLPYFKLSDPYITANARIKDLFTHNLGIGNADALWLVDSVSSRETIRKFQFAETAYPLRGGFIYQNIMYVVAGEVIEAVSGKPWSEFVRERIFIPLEMTRTKAIANDIFDAGNYVTPYSDDPDEGLVEVAYGFSDQIGAAGMICSTANDIANYLQFLVNGGSFKNDTLIKPSTFNYLFKPQVLLSESAKYPTNALTKPNWNSYGLGWFQQDYNGHKLDFHTGSLFGLVAIVGVMHDKNMAVYVFANLDHAELRHAIMYKALDLYAFNDDGRDWHTEVLNLYNGFKSATAERVKKKIAKRAMHTKPSLPLSAYEGAYTNEMLGNVKVSLANDELQLNFNDFISYEATHWHYDTFVTNKDPRFRQKLDVRFELNNAGEISQFEVLGQTFTKVAATNH